MKIHYYIVLVALIVYTGTQAQDAGFYFGPKVGLTVATQNWNGADRRPLLNYHFAGFLETLDPELKGSLYAQLGYHSRGSSLSIVNFLGGARSNRGFIYRNLSIAAGAKKRFFNINNNLAYYFVGIRLEYNISNNLEELQNEFNFGASALFYPLPDFVNPVVYGISIGGGYEFGGSDYIQPALELTISPDISLQYRDGPFENVINPFNGATTSIPERSIRNVSVEVSLVVKFLREVIYE